MVTQLRHLASLPRGGVPAVTLDRGEDAAAIARQAVVAIDRLHPGLGARVVGVRAHRRAEGTVTASVGGLGDAARSASEPSGRIFFAHADGQLASTIEAAVWEGQKAGMRAVGALRRRYTPGRALG